LKSLSERYSETHGNTHETFADLMFCALVLLVLFVMALAIEVSQRVRAEVAEVAEVTQVEKVEDIETLSPEEVTELSARLQTQQAELEVQRKKMLQQQGELRALRSRLAEQRATVQNRIAALRGEQRFTGATEPAKLLACYDYKDDRVVFVRQKEFTHATTRLSDEDTLTFYVRLRAELAELAVQSRRQRHYTVSEARKLYSAFTTYKQVNPTDSSYSVSNEKIDVVYSTLLSGYIAGDQEVSASAEWEIEKTLIETLSDPGAESDKMYPSATVTVLPGKRRLRINGVVLSPKDFKDLLLAMGGRGVMLDFEGYDGPAPDWLVEQVLKPTGYVGKTPKL